MALSLSLQDLRGAPGAASPLRSALPGLFLVAVITSASFGLRGVAPFSAVSPMILAIVFGMVFHNLVGTPGCAGEGVRLAGKRLLRIAVALLGLQLTFGEIAGIGAEGVAIAAIALASTFAFTVWAGRRLGVDPALSQLIAAGTSICGASAIAAANAVTRARDEDVSYAVACITLFGTIAMFAFPLLVPLLKLEPHAYGLFIGASVHEVAQVVGAAYQGGQMSGEVGIVAKLTRVLMLAPTVVVLGLLVARRSGRDGAAAGRPPAVPVFILAFVGLVGLNSLGILPEAPREVVVGATPILLTAAMGALGLGTDFAKLKARGPRPLILAGLATLFIALVAMLLVLLLA